MSTSKVQIANVALSRLGQTSINALDEGTEQANLVRNFWDHTREFLLHLHPWNFAIKREQLARLASNPLSGYDYQYALPTDNIRTLLVTSDEDDTNYIEDYRVEGGNILTDSEEVWLKYVFNNDVVATWPPLFREVFASRLQVELAYPITKAANVIDQATALYLDALRKAKNVDGQQDYHDPLGGVYSDFIGVRY